jgi:hypothetical protein
MDQKYKIITVKTINKDKREILDIENIQAEDLVSATVLSKDIQLAELKQNSQNFEIDSEDYQDAFIDVSNNVGIVQSGKENILLIVGENNAWYYCVNNTPMNELTEIEWNDFINELLNKEPGEKDLMEL